ncbi:HNH endonuclease [Flavobacterium aquatile]|uniref:HNH endonuclease n=1 Tax=Flavobacterium aquatile TaxID=245 RepID=UPI00068C04C8|nr:HNH endonuclease [Flavobacterium aquatile]OXA68191.1 hypothetical protein B0A61_04770 [Flavobacterium aquatile LMG 4008 = ATCC 11947]GEC80244.1 hypothetical protein FAQ01_31140 [Flavobacterium aquatile]
MTPEERFLKIDNNYSLYKSIQLNIDKNIYLGDKENKQCRFCKKQQPEVTFNTIAHAIPEFVNNHRLISYYECDSCNSKFARTIETHMGDYMNVYHTLSQVKGKRGVPSFSRGGEKSRVDHTSEGLKIDSFEGERENFVINEENNTVTFKAIRATYIPIAIYKCLTKMALSIMGDEELVNFENALKWINEEKHDESEFNIASLRCIFSITPGPLPHDFTTCMLFRRKDNNVDNVPYMQFLLAYGNYTFQIFLVMSNKDSNSGTSIMTPIPTPFDIENKYGKPDYKILDFYSKEKCKDDEVSLTMSYERMVKKDVDNEDE